MERRELLPLRRNRIAILLSVLAPLAFPDQSLAEMKEIIIRTLSTRGDLVTASVEFSVANDEWKEVKAETVSDGVARTFVETCDGSVKFKARKRDAFGFYTRRSPDGIKFCHTEIVFDDYVPTSIEEIISPGQLTSHGTWIAALGNDKRAASVGPGYADALKTALAQGEYGYIAIASSEVAASLRAAGLAEAAYPFELLSVQSTIIGVFKEKEVSPDEVPIFQTVPGTTTLTMSSKAKAILEQYQTEQLGISSNSQELGKTGWTTMRSLAGGEQVKAADWKIPRQEIQGFDATLFSGERM